jgi:hypothetical protein
LAGTKQRCSGFNQMRQCGDDVLRMLVTGGPPVGGGIISTAFGPTQLVRFQVVAEEVTDASTDHKLKEGAV